MEIAPKMSTKLKHFWNSVTIHRANLTTDIPQQLLIEQNDAIKGLQNSPPQTYYLSVDL